MKRRSLILVILFSVVASVALFNCGSSTDAVSSRFAGGWIINPDISNSLNFFVVSGSGAVTEHGFRSDSASVIGTTEDSFNLVLVNGVTSYFVNAAMVNSTSGTYTTYPDMETGTITRVPDLSACSQMSTAWSMLLTADIGASAPYMYKGTRTALSMPPSRVYFSVNAGGGMSKTYPGTDYDVTGGRMLCSGTSPDDLVVGLMATNSTIPYYSTVRFAGMVNGPASAWGLHDTDSTIPWPTGSFKMTEQCRLSGTVTFPDKFTSGVALHGTPYRIVIDTDSTVDNGNEAATYNLTWFGTDTTDYVINMEGVTPGAYYVYVEAVGATYFIYGWTGADVAQDYHNPRATVPIDCGTVQNLWMELT